ncbi:MAG: hypothetical protein IJY87_04595 [Bacilli bacterium]|nr:hypothetical protein [Bacilli bacterium]
MRLLVYYKPNKDIFVVNYKEDRHYPIELFTYNFYGNLVIQYIYIIDRKVFWNYESYYKYYRKKYKISKPSLKYRLGQGLITLGTRICFGTTDRTIYITRNQWWKK